MRRRLRLLAEGFLLPATSRSVLSRPVIATSVTFSVLIHLFGSVDLGAGSLLLRGLAATAAMVPMFVFIAVVQALPVPMGLRRAALVLTSYFVGGALRGAALALLLDAFGLEQGGGWQFRIPAGALNLGSLVAVIAFGWATYRAHREAAASLAQETRQLQDALARLELESEAETLRQVSDVAAGIVRELEAVQLHPAGAQVAEIQRLLDERVRPLSRQFAAGIEQWVPDERRVSTPSARALWPHLDPLRHLPSPWAALVVSLSTIPLTTARFGWEQSLQLALFLFATLWPAVFVGNAVARRLLASLHPLLRDAGITLLFVTVCALGAGSTVLALLDTDTPALFVWAGLGTFPFYSWVYLVASTFWGDAVAQERRLRRVRADLQWAIARVNLLAWSNRGTITRLLHGPIQNAMHATAIRLRNEPPQAVVDGVIDELRRRILDVDALASDTRAGDGDVTAALADLARVWAGIATIDIAASPAAQAALRADAAGAAIVLDLCQEAVSNAIRHGDAKQVRVRLDAQPRQLTLDVLDDGRGPAGAGTPGVGTRFLDTCSIHWTQDAGPEGNRLQVAIPSSA